jgi:ATP-dependent Clp protease ATP-binding subunit ClpB
MIAGTKFRGEFEDRLKAVVKEIIDSNGEIICFIDELHTLVGAGSAEGAIDAANLLKPALARGELRCIGATTITEYKKHVEKDAALARRFRTVMVGEPTVDDTIAILRGLKQKFEIHHGVTIRDSAILAAAVLSQRYIADRFLPDKAIDLIDEAGSALRLQIGSMPEEIDVLERRVLHLEIERQALTKESDSASRERLRAVENELEVLRGKAAPLKEKWNKERATIDRVRQLKEEQEALQKEEDRRLGKGGATPLRPPLADPEGYRSGSARSRYPGGESSPEEGNRRRRYRQDRLQVDRHSAPAHARRRVAEAHQHERAPQRSRRRSG